MTERVLLMILSASVMLLSAAPAQSISGLHTFFIGSNGTTTARAPDSERDLADYQKYLTRRLGLRPKVQAIVRPSPSPDNSVFTVLGSLFAEVDSSDLVVGACLGAWQSGQRPELSTLAGLAPDSLTADYLLHLTMFLPSHNAVLLVVAPEGLEFPRTGTSGLPTGIEGGGKYVIVIRERESRGYGSLLDRFSDLMDSAWDDARYDGDGDGFLTVSEWLTAFGRRAAGLGLSGTIVRVAEGTDLIVKQLRTQ